GAGWGGRGAGLRDRQPASARDRGTPGGRTRGLRRRAHRLFELQPGVLGQGPRPNARLRGGPGADLRHVPAHEAPRGRGAASAAVSTPAHLRPSDTLRSVTATSLTLCAGEPNPCADSLPTA